MVLGEEEGARIFRRRRWSELETEGKRKRERSVNFARE